MLTNEQKKIIACEDKMMVINAIAGSGKTSTLVEWCKARPNKKILYLVFGKSMSDEAKIMFKDCRNVEVKTTHSLAYKTYGYMYRDKLTFNYGVIDCLRDLKLNNDYDVAYSVIGLFNRFLASDSSDIEEFVSEVLTKNNMKNQYKIKSLAGLCVKLWNQSLDINSGTKISHDFYLKLYQLAKPNLGKEYEVIILDEGQDLTLVTKGILDTSSPKTKIIIGDNLQSIYGWRHCVNLLGMYPNATHLELTGSFRVNQQIADMCTDLIKTFKFKNVKMTGYNKNQKIYKSDHRVDFASGSNGRWNVITRKNATILAHAIEATMRGKTLFFEGGIKSYPFQFYKSLYWFRATGKTYDRNLKKYGTWEDLVEFVRETEDIELSCAINVLNAYMSKVESFPEAIDEIYAHTTENKQDADFVYCTAHKSKGLTFTEPVFLENDFINLKDTYKMLLECKDEIAINMVLAQISQEINLLYVALTRAKGELYLNDDVSNFF